MDETAVKDVETGAPAMVQLSEIKAPPTLGDNLLTGNLDVVQNVKVRLAVTAGEATVSIGELLGLKSGQVLKLDSLADSPLDIVLDGKTVARGELVAVDDNFGVRIVELPRAAGARG